MCSMCHASCWLADVVQEQDRTEPLKGMICLTSVKKVVGLLKTDLLSEAVEFDPSLLGKHRRARKCL